MPVYVCPSDPVAGGNNYRVCTGSTASSSDAGPNWEELSNGAFLPWEVFTAADFSDGLSNTVAASEKLKSDLDPESYDPDVEAWFTSVGVFGPPPVTEEMVRLCGSLSGQPTAHHANAGRTWMVPGYHHTWYNHAVTPNAPTTDCDSNSPPGFAAFPAGGVYKANSHHRGGVNVLMMDGAVRFVADGIDLSVWRAAASRADGETVAF